MVGDDCRFFNHSIDYFAGYKAKTAHSQSIQALEKEFLKIPSNGQQQGTRDSCVDTVVKKGCMSDKDKTAITAVCANEPFGPESDLPAFVPDKCPGSESITSPWVSMKTPDKMVCILRSSFHIGPKSC